MLGYFFSLFSSDPLRQLVYLAPIIGISTAIIMLGLTRLRRHKQTRPVIGHYIMATLAAYAIFILMMLALGPTATSYGKAQPVIIVFGVFYLLGFGLTLGLLAISFKWAWCRRQWHYLLGGYYLLQIAMLGLLFYAFYIEPHWVDVTRTTIVVERLAPGAGPIKIALISDIHMERWTRREDSVIENLNAIDPDLLVISGDHINIDHYTPETYADLHRFFNSLHARYGVYAVAGTVDSIDATHEVVAGTPVRFLDDEAATLNINGQPLQLVGLKSKFPNDGDYLAALTQNLPAAPLRLLLYHTPDLAQLAPQAGIDLYLAGHTHGGQIALPFYGAIFTASAFGRRYAAGLYNLGVLRPAICM